MALDKKTILGVDYGGHSASYEGMDGFGRKNYTGFGLWRTLS